MNALSGRSKVFPRLVCAGGTATTASRQDPREEVLDAEVGAMPMAFGTAHNLLTRAGVQAGSRVLVVFAGQPVGYAALRLAVIRGARLFALCPDSAIQVARAAGARPLQAAELAGTEPFDAIIDLAAGPNWRQYLRHLKPRGLYATTGAIAEAPAPREDRKVFLNDLTQFDRPHRSRELFAGLVTTVTAPHLRLMPQPRN